MKKLIFIFYLIPVLGFAQPVTDGLVGYWPFNGNANDESGNGNDGVVNGAILTMDRFGNANSAYEFDGVNDFIEIGDMEFEDKVSISVWVKLEDLNTDYTIVGKWKNPYEIILYMDRGHGGKSWRALIIDSNSNSIATSVDDNSAVAGEWQHIAMTYDGSSLKIYANGVVTQYKNGGNGLRNGTNELGIGVDAVNNLQRFFKGTIDDVRIYNRALTTEEVQELYTGVTPPPTPELCNNIYCDSENIGIGTPNTQGYKLAVAGDFVAQKVKVALQEQWPDYVFDEDYELEDLQKLEQYIKTHGHLPNIPDAATIKEEGLDLGEMNAKLLEKIEELSLYIIEQDKELINQQREIDIQSKLNQNQERKIEVLEEQNEQLKSYQKEIELLKERMEKLENK